MTSDGNEAVGLTAGFKTAPTSVISDNLERLPGAVGLRPFHHGGSMAGLAFTIRTAAGDNRAIHQALELFRPGDVLVVEGGGDTSRALIGEIIAQIPEHPGAAGFVIDGAIRDAGALARSRFPVFARAAIHRGPYKNGPGETNVPISADRDREVCLAGPVLVRARPNKPPGLDRR